MLAIERVQVVLVVSLATEAHCLLAKTRQGLTERSQRDLVVHLINIDLLLGRLTSINSLAGSAGEFFVLLR